MICSPSGFCASLSWSIESCGKRGSLLVAGAANIVAANQPPAAATASDDIQTEAECMISSVLFLFGRAKLMQRRGARQPDGAYQPRRIRSRRYRSGVPG